MTAEYAFKAALGADPLFRVSSAGTEAIPQAMVPFVQERLLQRGLDVSAHRQRRITAEILAQTDLAVAMGVDHQTFLRRHFNCDAPLFNQICFGNAEPILDIWEAVPNYLHDRAAVTTYGVSVVDYICEAMPRFLANVEGFFTLEKSR